MRGTAFHDITQVGTLRTAAMAADAHGLEHVVKQTPVFRDEWPTQAVFFRIGRITQNKPVGLSS